MTIDEHIESGCSHMLRLFPLCIAGCPEHPAETIRPLPVENRDQGVLNEIMAGIRFETLNVLYPRTVFSHTGCKWNNTVHMPPGPVSPALICSFLIFFFLKSDIIKITLITIITKWCYYTIHSMLYHHLSMAGDQDVRREIFRERTLQRHEGFRRPLLQWSRWAACPGAKRRNHLRLQDRQHLEKWEEPLMDFTSTIQQ